MWEPPSSLGLSQCRIQVHLIQSFIKKESFKAKFKSRQDASLPNPKWELDPHKRGLEAEQLIPKVHLLRSVDVTDHAEDPKAEAWKLTALNWKQAVYLGWWRAIQKGKPKTWRHTKIRKHRVKGNRRSDKEQGETATIYTEDETREANTESKSQGRLTLLEIKQEVRQVNNGWT